MTYLGFFMSEIRYGNLKSAVLLANEHQSDQRNVTNDFRIMFRYVIVHAKTTLSFECQRM